MQKADILNTLTLHKNTLKEKFEIDKIGLFGSYARDEATSNSDIDIYVEFKNKTFDNIAGLWVYLEELYHKRIDLIHFHKRANKTIINNIQKEVIYG
jgi:hypothetical protein